MRPRFRHLVFDLDGTLVDTKDDLAEAVNVSLQAIALPREDPRTLWGYVGMGARVLVERALGPSRAHLLEPALATFMSWYRLHLLDRSTIYPGLAAALGTLAAEGVMFSILTNKPADMSLAIIRGLGLETTFPRVVGGDTLTVKKPDPAGLMHLVRAAGVPLESTLMVGDSVIDIATGRNAGVATCGVLWGFNDGMVRPCGADVFVTTPEQLQTLCRVGVPRG